MKAALIPPIRHLEEYAGRDRFHLILSHLLDNPAYASFYREQRLRGSYLVLDNGAHENNAGEAMKDLLLKAHTLRVDEVVIPDTLFDRDATVQGAKDAFSYLLVEGQDLLQEATFPTFMLVPQAREFEDWQGCFMDLVTEYVKAQAARPDLFPRRLTIGVSKDYDWWEGGHHALLAFLEPFKDWLPFDAHLLGWARDLTVLRDLARVFPWIRSTDSAKPFVYALRDIRLRPGASPTYPTRDPNYFDQVMDTRQREIAKYNVKAFREAAHDSSR